MAPGEKGLEAGYYMAQIEFSRGQYADVISRGRSLLSENRSRISVRDQPHSGTLLFQTGRISAGAPLSHAISRSDRRQPFPDALYALGAIAYADRDYAGAENIFRKDSSRILSPTSCRAPSSISDNAPSPQATHPVPPSPSRKPRADIDPKVTETALC